MFNRYQFPYTNFHDLNLDWLLDQMKKLVSEWEQMKIDWQTFQDRMEALYNEFTARIEGEWAAYKDDMNDQWDAYKSNLNSEWADYKTAMNGAWAQYQNNLNSQWNTYKSNLNSEWNTFKTELNAWKAGMNSDWANYQTTMNNKFDNLQSFVTNYFDNVDWESMVDNLFEGWRQDGTLIAMIAPYLPFLTPEMYGAKADGATDDRTALNNMMIDAAGAKKAVWMAPTSTYYCSDQVNIPGPVDVHGNGSTIEFAAGKKGLVFTADGEDSTIENMTITSRSAQWPDLGITSVQESAQTAWRDAFAGLILTGPHIKVDRVNINNFGIGLYADESIAGDYNQTGYVITNCHIRYCGVAARFGKNLRNGKTTDYTITDCTFAGRHFGLFIADGIGYLIHDIHTWGLQTEGDRPLCGIYALNMSITSMDQIYVEPCELYGAYIHTRKGYNISNFTYVASFDTRLNRPTVFYMDGAANDFEVNLDNIIIRSCYKTGEPTTYLKPILIHQARRGLFNIGNVIVTEALTHDIGGTDVDYHSVQEGVSYDVTDQTWGFFYLNNALLKPRADASSYLLQIHGRNIITGAQMVTTPDLKGSGETIADCFIPVDMLQPGEDMAVDITAITRDAADVVAGSKHTIYVHKTQSSQFSVVQHFWPDPNNPPHSVNAILTPYNGKLSVWVNLANLIGPNVSPKSGSLIVEPKYPKLSVYQTPETYPTNQ